MDDMLYATSFTIYALPPSLPPLFLNSLSLSNASLQAHASRLYDHVTSTSRHPAYEAEEEKERLGSLRTCEVSSLPNEQGIAIAVIYDRAVSRFVLYVASQSAAQRRCPLLLAKANASLTRRVFSYLTGSFHLPSEPSPLKLSSNTLLLILQNYIFSLRQSLDPVAETESILSLLRDIIGTLKITISVNTGSARGSSIASSLRTIDLDVPSETLYQLLEKSMSKRPSQRSKTTFLTSLRDFTKERTGLILPITPAAARKPHCTVTDGATPAEEPPLRVTRIQSTAFAISMEGRLKFSSKPVEMMDVIPGLTSGEENVVKLANQDLLDAIVKEAESVQSNPD